MIRRAGYLGVTLALLVGGALPMAWASRQQQGKSLRLKACVGLIPTPGGEAPVLGPPFAGSPADPDAVVRQRSPDPNPYIFYVLDQRKDLKPDGWEFYNPAAPAFVTREKALRWGGVSAAAPPLSVGQPLKADMGAYWEELISDANFPRLRQMDVIYIPIARDNTATEPQFDAAGLPIPGTFGAPVATMFTEEQRRVLTKLADAGVTIWIDWALPTATVADALGGFQGATPTSRLKNQFFTNLDTINYPGTASAPVSGHPLLTAEYQINDPLLIGKSNTLNPALASAGRAFEIRSLEMSPNANFARVVPAGTIYQAYIAGARFGAGFIVATAGDVGAAISQMVNPLSSSFGSQDLNRAEAEDLKFGYNVFGWAMESAGPAKNSRHTGQTSEQLNGLIEQTTFPGLIAPGAAGAPWQPYPTGVPSATLPINPASPLILDSTVVAAVRYMRNGTLVQGIGAFEANPTDDYDGNGFIDDPLNAGSPAGDPLADIGIGQSYDMLTFAPVPNSSLVLGMTAGEIPDATNPQGARAFIFAACAGNIGIYSLPALRPGPAPGNWSVPTVTTGTNVNFTGAPAFALLPDDPILGTTIGQLYGGGRFTASGFGGGLPGSSNGNGKVVAYSVRPSDGKLGYFNGPTFVPDVPRWYYPPDTESNRMGAISGPMTASFVQDLGTGTMDQIVFGTSVSSGDPNNGAGGGQAGDTTGKVEGFITASWGDPLTFPRGNPVPGGNNPTAGRTFVAARWIDLPPGAGQVPQPRELMWDPNRYYEVRVMDKAQNYVLARYRKGDSGVNLLPNGTAGQIEMPAPPAQFQTPAQPGVWDLNRFVLLADYAVLPQPVDNNVGQTIRPRFSPPTPYVRGANQVVQPTGIAGGVAVGKDNLVYYGTGQGYMCASEWRRGRAQFRWKIRSLDYQDQSGLSTDVDPTSPAFLADYAFTSAPAAGERIVFASKGRGIGGGNGQVYVFEPDATIKFKLGPDPAGGPQLDTQTAQDVQLQADHGVGFLPTSPFLGATQQPWGRLPNQFTVDPDTRTVTFNNMENFSLDLSPGNVLSPTELAAIGIDTGGRPATRIKWKYRTEVGATGRDAWIPLPLVAIYQPTLQADSFRSTPVIAGDRIYMMGASGNLHQIPLDPKTVDPRFPVRVAAATGLTGFNVGNVGFYGPDGLRRLKAVATGANVPPSIASPAIGPGMVAIASPRGVTTYTNPNVVVSDTSRVIEATGDSVAQATTDVTVKHRTDANPFAIPTDPTFANTGTLPIFTEKKLLNRPSKVVKLDRRSSLTSLFTSTATLDAPIDGITGVKENPTYAESSYLAADTGNNRAVEFNPAGKVVWEALDFQDPLGILPAGESLKLNGPRDVQRWVEREADPANAAVPLFVIHTLIADTGNTRAIELVDKVRYIGGGFNFGSYPSLPGQVGADGDPIQWYHVLVWSSQTNAQGLRLKYTTVSRVLWWDAAANGTIGAPAVMNPTTVPPYLPNERYLSYTMCSVQGQEVSYPGTPTVAGYLQTNPALPPEVLDRKPIVRPGGDSIVFLRGRYKADEGSGLTPVAVGSGATPFAYREASPSSVGDRYRFTQGVVDPNVPIITKVRDEVLAANPLNIVHTLNGVSSIQRTIRADVKFAAETYNPGAPMTRLMYFLIADTDGVWEFRLVPGAGTAHLSMAFTNGDYAYVTGAGNGDPTRAFSTVATDNDPGGRRFSPSSARRLPSGLVLITSRTPPNEQAGFSGGGSFFQQLNQGGDVFLLRGWDFRTVRERVAIGGVNGYDAREVPFHGWQPDQWVQTIYAANVPALLQGAPSIRWRAAEAVNPNARPTLRTQLEAGANPYDLSGSYVPVQPTFADLAP